MIELSKTLSYKIGSSCKDVYSPGRYLIGSTAHDPPEEYNLYICEVNMILPVILAGGSGTRLWPLSRELHPKQLLCLINENSMLQNTVLRLSGLKNIGDPIVLCNDQHRFMVAEQLRLIKIDRAVILLEPVGRNTAPAIAVAALKAVKTDPDAVLLVLPADHDINNIESFHKAVLAGADLAEQGYLITFGIIPDGPETGYGYIRKGGKPDLFKADNAGSRPEIVLIDKFVEKPDMETAVHYVESGDYCWNSGMFMFKASTVLEELEKHVPEIVRACTGALAHGKDDLDFFRLNRKAFEACPSDSIDYAVMEKTRHGAMILFEAGWDDLGSWEALWQVGQKDEQQNVIHGDVLVHDVKNSLLYASDRMITAVGLEDHIVVETADAVLISPRDRVQDIKKLVSRLKTDNRSEAHTHRKVYRPWGTYETIDKSKRFLVKRTTVKPGSKLSLQKHFHRAEHWIVVRGTALVTRGEDQFILREDESTYIPLGIPHRLENPGRIPLEIIEVQSGSYLDEKDIVRMEDMYGRQDDK